MARGEVGGLFSSGRSYVGHLPRSCDYSLRQRAHGRNRARWSWYGRRTPTREGSARWGKRPLAVSVFPRSQLPQRDSLSPEIAWDSYPERAYSVGVASCQAGAATRTNVTPSLQHPARLDPERERFVRGAHSARATLVVWRLGIASRCSNGSIASDL